jgi:hypothetical protein
MGKRMGRAGDLPGEPVFLLVLGGSSFRLASIGAAITSRDRACVRATAAVVKAFATGSQSKSATSPPSSLPGDDTTKTTLTTKVIPAGAEHDATDGSLAVATSWAETLKRLNPDRPPGDIPLRRWHAFIADVGKFLEDSWADRAMALGLEGP